MFQLHIKSLEYSTSKLTTGIPIWGKIYVELDGYCFPDNDWDDAVSSILDMWIPDIIGFLNSKNSKCELHFMDGPYRICLNWISATRIKISMFRGRIEENSGTCDIVDFLNPIIDGINSFSNLCKETNPSFLSNYVFTRIITSKEKLNDLTANLK